MYPLMLAMVLAQVGFFPARDAPRWMAELRRDRRLHRADGRGEFHRGLRLRCGRSVVRLAPRCGAAQWPRARYARVAGRVRRPCRFRDASAIRIGHRFTAWLRSNARNVVLDPAAETDRPTPDLRERSGAWVFVLCAALALWGVLTRWRWRREQIAFALILMWLPPLAQLAISYLFIPMDVTRYVLPSFIAFYILAALGIAALGSARARGVAAALVALTMLTHVYRYDSKPRDRLFREAVALAIVMAPGRRRIGIVSWDGSNRSAFYYATTVRRADLVRLPPEGELPPAAAQIRTLILPSYMRPAELARCRTLFPRVEGKFRLVEVRSK